MNKIQAAKLSAIMTVIAPCAGCQPQSDLKTTPAHTSTPLTATGPRLLDEYSYPITDQECNRGAPVVYSSGFRITIKKLNANRIKSKIVRINSDGKEEGAVGHVKLGTLQDTRLDTRAAKPLNPASVDYYTRISIAIDPSINTKTRFYPDSQVPGTPGRRQRPMVISGGNPESQSMLCVEKAYYPALFVQDKSAYGSELTFYVHWKKSDAVASYNVAFIVEESEMDFPSSPDGDFHTTIVVDPAVKNDG